MASCVRKTKKFLSIIKAVLSRSLFVFHGLISIWRVTQIKRNPIYWSLSGTLPFMVAETIYTLCKKKDGEWKWVCPSVVLYLATSVPAIWFLELDLMRQRLMMGAMKGAMRQATVNTSHSDVFVLNGKMIRFAISLGSEEWCKILEQLLLLILIIGRWLLPKGEITREQLSQLLLVYIGMAADIIELFEAFKEQTVRENTLLTIVILSLWTASLTQFTFVITATKAKKTRLATSDTTSEGNSCCPTEVISILISVLLQDAPFLVLRMLLIFRYDVLSYTNIFFTCKNTLVLVLQFYRLTVLFTLTPVENAVHVSTPATFHSSDDTLKDPYDSSASSDESSITDKQSTIERRPKKLSKRRREMRRQHTEDSAKTISSSMERAGTTESLENECRTSKKSEGRMRASLVFKRTRCSSDSSNSRSPREKRLLMKKKCAGSATNDQELSDGRKGKIKVTGNFKQGEVHRKIKRFEKNSEAINDSDATDNINSEESAVSQETKIKPKDQNKVIYKDEPNSKLVLSEDYHRKAMTNSDRQTSKLQERQYKHQWNSVKDLQSAMTFLNESGKYKTVIVKSDDEGNTMYVIEK